MKKSLIIAMLLALMTREAQATCDDGSSTPDDCLAEMSQKQKLQDMQMQMDDEAAKHRDMEAQMEGESSLMLDRQLDSEYQIEQQQHQLQEQQYEMNSYRNLQPDGAENGGY